MTAGISLLVIDYPLGERNSFPRTATLDLLTFDLSFVKMVSTRGSQVEAGANYKKKLNRYSH